LRDFKKNDAGGWKHCDVIKVKRAMPGTLKGTDERRVFVDDTRPNKV
jgi:hypothetical protein